MIRPGVEVMRRVSTYSRIPLLLIQTVATILEPCRGKRFVVPRLGKRQNRYWRCLPILKLAMKILPCALLFEYLTHKKWLPSLFDASSCKAVVVQEWEPSLGFTGWQVSTNPNRRISLPSNSAPVQVYEILILVQDSGEIRTSLFIIFNLCVPYENVSWVWWLVW